MGITFSSPKHSKEGVQRLSLSLSEDFEDHQARLAQNQTAGKKMQDFEGKEQ
jgi:hypothetical protein